MMRRRWDIANVEFQKTVRYRLVWIILIAFGFFVLLAITPGYQASGEDRSVFLLNLWPSVVRDLGKLILLASSSVVLILGTNEFLWGTASQSVVDGLSRMEYLQARLIQGTFVSLSFWLLAAIVVVAVIVRGTGLAGLGEYLLIPSNILPSLGLALALWGYACFAVLVAVVVRSPGPAFAVFAGYIFLVEPGFASFIVSVTPDSGVPDLLPVSSFESVLESSAHRAQASSPSSGSELPVQITMMVLYAFSAVGAAALVLRKRDLPTG
jgi:hypothetical protein